MNSLEANTTHYRSLVDKLVFLINTRLGIIFVVNLVSKYLQKPQETHLKVTKSILWCLKGTVNTRLFYRIGIDLILIRFIDTNWGGDVDSKKLAIGYFFTLGGTQIFDNNKKILWLCHLQNMNLKHSWKAQKKDNGFATYLLNLAWIVQKPYIYTHTHFNNESCIKIVKDLVYHLAIHLKYIQQLTKNGRIKVIYVLSINNMTNQFITKVLGKRKNLQCKNPMGMAT